MTTADDLASALEFDHVITIGADGTISDASGIYAPSLLDESLDSDQWRFVTDGYSRQDGYSGPIMHNSELIGGRLADDILSEPGTYAAIVAYWSSSDDDEEGETDIEGWAIVRYVGGTSTS